MFIPFLSMTSRYFTRVGDWRANDRQKCSKQRTCVFPSGIPPLLQSERPVPRGLVDSKGQMLRTASESRLSLHGGIKAGHGQSVGQNGIVSGTVLPER